MIRNLALRSALLAPLLLPGCTNIDKGARDTADTGTAPTDTGDTGAPTGSLSGAATIITGVSNRAAGTALAAADLNGDGLADIAVSAYAGGPACVFEGPIPAGTFALESGACHTPVDTFDFAGFSVAGSGDMDGDGREELLIGAIAADGDAGDEGVVYIADGSGGSLSAAIMLQGQHPLDYAGSSVAPAGDTDGDGFNDILIGATGNPDGGQGGGAAYLILGPPAAGSLDDAHAIFLGAGGAAGRHATPGGGDGVGYALSSGGDLNADGFMDVLLGAAGSDGADTDTGKACVFLGPVPAGTHLIADADVCFLGASASAFAGDRVAPAGDTDGDGRSDLLISADGEDNQRGTVYLWRGVATGSAGNLSLSFAPVAWTGEAEQDQAGYAITAGDSDGDGLSDVFIGAWANDSAGLDAGRTYILTAPFSDGVHPLTADTPRRDGERESDYAGRALAAGDTDGDGTVELLIGAPFASFEGPAAGRAYLISAP